MVLNIKPLADAFKEHFVCSVYLKDEAKEVDVMQFKKYLDAQDYILSTHFIDKDSAAALLQADLGDDEKYMDLLDGTSFGLFGRGLCELVSGFRNCASQRRSERRRE